MLSAGYDRDFQLVEEVDQEDIKPGEVYPVVLGASYVARMSELMDEDIKKGTNRSCDGFINYYYCAQAKIKQLMDGALELIMRHTAESRSNIHMLMFVGMGDTHNAAFSGPMILGPVYEFLGRVQDINDNVGRQHKVAFAQLTYPPGMDKDKYSKIDEVNSELYSTSMAEEVDLFNTGRFMFKDSEADMDPNVWVQGMPKFSPGEHWRRYGNIHPSDEVFRKFDTKARKFVNNCLREPKDFGLTGVRIMKRKRTFTEAAGAGNDLYPNHVILDDVDPDTASHVPGLPSDWKTKQPAEKKSKTYHQRQAKFEKSLEGLSEEEKVKKRQERADRQAKSYKERMERGAKSAETMKEDHKAKYEERLKANYKKALESKKQDWITQAKNNLLRAGVGIPGGERN